RADVTDSAGSQLCGKRAGRGRSHRLVLALMGSAAPHRQLAPMDLRTALDGEFPYGAAVTVYQAPWHQIPNCFGSGLCALWTVRQLSYRGHAHADVSTDAIHCGDRKFANLTRWNRNDSVGLHLGFCPVREQGQSVRAVPCCKCLQPFDPHTDGTSHGYTARGRSSRGRRRISDQAQGRPAMTFTRWQKRSVVMLLGLALSSVALMSHAADDQGARETVERVARLFSSKSSIATVKMQISNEDGQRDISMKIWSLGEKVLVRITSPQDEAGTAILKVGSDIWYYLPKSNRTVN